MTRNAYTNEALTAAVDLLLHDYGLTLDEVKHLSADLPGEFEATQALEDEPEPPTFDEALATKCGALARQDAAWALK